MTLLIDHKNKTMSERTTSSSWALAIVQALELGGVDCVSLFAELGMDHAALSDPDARFPQDGMTRLWQRAVALSGNPAIGLNMAQALLLSQRTLQRRLQEEGTSYQQLLDDTRRELAEQYLGQVDLTLLEVAYLLGFADPSNFFRAFRRWFGETPGEYRGRRGLVS